jgi:hypothetical protein
MNQGIDFYNLSQELAGAIFGALFQKLEQPADQPPPLLQLRRGRAEAPAWFLVQAAEFEPEPISVEKLRVRDIYASKRIVFALLELMASEKWLEPMGEGQYVLAPAGRAIQDGLNKRRSDALKKVTVSLDPARLARLESLLERLIESSLIGEDPPGSWCLRRSRNRAPGKDALPLERILQYTSDFNAFRDDAHMAAWQPYELSGCAWEGFSFVWSGQADTAEEIDQQLYYRGYTTKEYTAALQELVQRGWLEEKSAGHYSLTPTGVEIREEAERQTDQYFYTPWRSLQETDVGELHTLLLQLKNGLQQNA